MVISYQRSTMALNKITECVIFYSQEFEEMEYLGKFTSWIHILIQYKQILTNADRSM